MYLSREFHEHISKSRTYSLLIGFGAFFLMLSGLVPFEVVLIPAVAAAPQKWKKVWIAGVIGSALGATALAALFRYFGWPLVDHLIPSLASSSGWGIAQRWMSSYGAFALIAISALPIAQAPALVLCGLLQTPLVFVVLAYLIGKTARYYTVSTVVLKSEARLKHLRQS